ncbi:hypothetical protein [Bradyrhizobium sp. sBnM-33]|uniref:hypothetical protein n=1 Tax=Bradyrhizobium sp. sBnM-33 TaxID=2831780 RepID=UPI001BD06ADB|nr:hypothetical protein [Bradyrhizobium sp. sBnM-33]WOH53295.1 hypothetical protein RX328_15145 [Bradyrhizobium sp. sBnM-33]
MFTRKRPYLISAVLLLAVAIPPTDLLLLTRTPLLLESMSVIALAFSAIVALAAWCLSSDRDGVGITLWDVSGAYAFIGFAAGMLSDPQQVLEL